MFNIGYCEAWPGDLKELYWTYYRAWQRVRNLTAYVERVDPDEFYVTMTDLEQAQKSLYCTAEAFRRANAAWDAEHGHLTIDKASQA